mgnify:FL=1
MDSLQDYNSDPESCSGEYSTESSPPSVDSGFGEDSCDRWMEHVHPYRMVRVKDDRSQIKLKLEVLPTIPDDEQMKHAYQTSPAEESVAWVRKALRLKREENKHFNASLRRNSAFQNPAQTEILAERFNVSPHCSAMDMTDKSRPSRPLRTATLITRDGLCAIKRPPHLSHAAHTSAVAISD